MTGEYDVPAEFRIPSLTGVDHIATVIPFVAKVSTMSGERSQSPFGVRISIQNTVCSVESLSRVNDNFSGSIRFAAIIAGSCGGVVVVGWVFVETKGPAAPSQDMR